MIGQAGHTLLAISEYHRAMDTTSDLPIMPEPATDPLLALDTEEMRLSSPRGDDASGAVMLANRGGGLLEGAVTVRVGTEWLRVTPTTLRLAPGETCRLAVRADPAGLAPGYTRGEIEIASNGGSATIGVRLGVQGGRNWRALGRAVAVSVTAAIIVGALLARVTTPTGAPPPNRDAMTARGAGSDSHDSLMRKDGRLADDDTGLKPLAVAGFPVLTVRQVFDRIAPAVVRVEANSAAGTAIGTGFVIHSTLHGSDVITNDHVVHGAAIVKLQQWRGSAYYPARPWVVSRRWEDPADDLAVIHIDQGNLPTVAWGDSEALQPADEVVAIGYAANLYGGPTVSHGIVSSLRRTIPNNHNGPFFIGHSAFLNHGSSGGPLADMSGRVVGINTWTLGNTQGLFFAIPSARAARAAADFIARNG